MFVEKLLLLADPAEFSSAHEAEIMVSVLLGTSLEAGAAGEVLTDILLDAIDELARGDRLRAYPALRVLAAIGPPEISGHAARAAERAYPEVAADGTPPSWIEDLDAVTTGTCVRYTDAYGERQILLCEFSYAAGRNQHAVYAVTDATWHGAIVQLVIDDDPAKTRKTLGKRVRREGGELTDLSAAEAGTALMAGIAAFLQHGSEPGPASAKDNYAMLCSSLFLTRSRAALMVPETKEEPAGTIADRWPQAAQRQLAEEFLASPHASELRDPVARMLPFLYISTCVNQLGCDPLLLGPLLLDRVLMQVFPAVLLVPDRFADTIPPFMSAWTDWIADQHKLAGSQRRMLLFRLTYLLRRFPQAWRGPAVGPLRRYVQDLPDEVATVGAELMSVVQRRTFAVPEPAARSEGIIEGTSGPARHASELDAADERDRTMITLNYLNGRGLQQQRFAPYLTVTDQLWTGEPAEVWAAAQRMRAAGLSRDAILDRLARVWAAVEGKEPTVYVAGLAKLSPGSAGRR
jgi:hypothetical protein